MRVKLVIIIIIIIIITHPIYVSSAIHCDQAPGGLPAWQTLVDVFTESLIWTLLCVTDCP